LKPAHKTLSYFGNVTDGDISTRLRRGPLNHEAWNAFCVCLCFSSRDYAAPALVSQSTSAFNWTCGQSAEPGRSALLRQWKQRRGRAESPIDVDFMISVLVYVCSECMRNLLYDVMKQWRHRDVIWAFSDDKEGRI